MRSETEDGLRRRGALRAGSIIIATAALAAALASCRGKPAVPGRATPVRDDAARGTTDAAPVDAEAVSPRSGAASAGPGISKGAGVVLAATDDALVRAADASEKDIEIPRRPGPARTKGWSWKVPADQVRPDSGRRSNVFYVGEPVEFALGGAARSYEVRDYRGRLVDKGAAGARVAVKAERPGWYKLYVYGGQTRPQWGDIVGTTNFVIFRRDPNFPPLPPKNVPGGFYPSEDEPMRGVTGMGPQRHSLRNPEKPDEMIGLLQRNVDLDRKYYLPFDPVRKRALMCAFPNGTAGKLDGVRKIVAHFKDDVRYWEPRNEPNFGSGGADFVEKELKDFHAAVKQANPEAKVMGPGTVSIGPQLTGWLEDFFGAGGGRYLDAFSFHIYNGINGDIVLSRWTMDSLAEMLAKYGLADIEKWQTEQGFFACVYGSYQPRLQGRWTMLEMMIFEQYGLPKEHNHLWYDRSHGFWDFPTWWENDDGGLNPAAAMMRVMAEELHGTTFKRKYGFGKDGDRLFLGSLFEGPGKSVAAFMNAGAGRRRIALRVNRGGELRTVSVFGVKERVPVERGLARLTVPEVPVYVELAPGHTVEPVPMDWGRNLAREEGVTVTSSGTGAHPVDKKIPNDSAKLVNGFLENWYWGQQTADQEWMDDTEGFPAWVAFRLPKATEVARVVVFAGVPWQWRGTLVDYELQYDRDGKWVTIERVKEPTKTWGVYSPPTRTTVDSFFSDRWIFEHRFRPVRTQAVRLLVHDVTWGGGATEIVPEAGGQTGPHNITLREVEIYGPEPELTVRATTPSRFISGAFDRTPVTVTVANRTGVRARGSVRLTVPDGWKAVPPELSLSLAAGEVKTAEVAVVPPRTVPAGPVAVDAAVTDSRGREVDRDAVTLKVFGPADLALQPPAEVDRARQPFAVVATNVTSKPIRSTLELNARETTPGGGRPVTREEPLSIPPHGRVTVEFTVPGVDLVRSAWRVACRARIGRMEVTATRDYAVRAWKVLGPFANEFDRDFGPEPRRPGGKRVDLGAKYETRAGRAGWKQAVSDASGFVDLLKPFQPNNHVCAYAVVYVKSPEARKARLSAGSDDGVKIWLNGKLVVSNNVARGAAPGQEKADVDLAAGWNEVLVKVTQGVGGWGFYFDLLDAEGKPVEGLQYADSPERE